VTAGVRMGVGHDRTTEVVDELVVAHEERQH
jgi:hypothetical protein